MSENINYIINYSEGNLSGRNKQKFEKSLQEDQELRQDYLVFKQINEYMRAKSDLEDVNSDPALREIEAELKESVSDYYQHQEKYKKSQKFIQNSVDQKFLDFSVKNEINQVIQEIQEYDVNQITEGWVKEWIEKKQDRTAVDPKTERIKNYIKQSLESEKNTPGLRIVHKEKFNWKNTAILRSTGLIAALLISGMLVFRILIPSGDPGKLYGEFYKPMDVVSPVTRGTDSNTSDKYAEAIEFYKLGNYQLTASLLNGLIQTESSSIPVHFLLGITQLELGNYDQAVSYLSTVTSSSREFMKEAQWYLGLAYLKTGEPAKAKPYFEKLSGSPGFYNSQSIEILRRLE